MSLPNRIALLLRPSLSCLVFILFPAGSTSYPLNYGMSSNISVISHHVAPDICLFHMINTHLCLFSSFSQLSLAHPFFLLTQITCLFTFPYPLLISFMIPDTRLYFNKLEANLLKTSIHLLILPIVKDWSLLSVFLLITGKSKSDIKVFSTYPETFASSCTRTAEQPIFLNLTRFSFVPENIINQQYSATSPLL